MGKTQIIKSFKKTITFAAAGLETLLFDRDSQYAGLGTYQTYFIDDTANVNVDTVFTDLIIDPSDSGINGAYCIETDPSNLITVDNTTFDDTVKRFQSTDIIYDTAKTIRRLRIYADRAGDIDIVLEYNKG
jgi:hypothetical protein